MIPVITSLVKSFLGYDLFPTKDEMMDKSLACIIYTETRVSKKEYDAIRAYF